MAKVAVPLEALDGIVMSVSSKRMRAYVKVLRSQAVVDVPLRAEDMNLEEDDRVQIQADGTLVHVSKTSEVLEIHDACDTTSTGLEIHDNEKMEMRTVMECFVEAQGQQCRASGFKVGTTSVRSSEEWASLSKSARP